MRTKLNYLKQRLFHVIKRNDYITLQYTPDDRIVQEFEKNERKLRYDNSAFYKRNLKAESEEKEEVDFKNLSERGLILLRFYLAHNKDNSVILSDKETSEYLKWSLRTVQRYKQELKKHNYIKVLYNQQRKVFEIHI